MPYLLRTPPSIAETARIAPAQTMPPVWEEELWTAKQRQMHSVHYAISYRASFKPELPHFFIQHYLLDKRIKNATILDPFGGRGTSCLQANLMGFSAIHNDINPVSIFLAQARQNIPNLENLLRRTEVLELNKKFHLSSHEKKRFLPFFHKRTLNEILNLRELLRNTQSIAQDPELAYIGLSALSRLHGHSDGFLSVYSFPQISISPVAQARNNERRNQKPQYRPIKPRIIRKIKSDLRMPLPAIFTQAACNNRYLQDDAQKLKNVADNSVDLIITSPPFLDKVDYQLDNWMRAWFLGIEEAAADAPVTVTANLNEWCDFMQNVMRAMGRVLKVGAYAVIEVGEVNIGHPDKRQNYNLEEQLLARLPLVVSDSMIEAKEIFINKQNFTKLSHCWDIANNHKGTNTNRCLVLQKRRI